MPFTYDFVEIDGRVPMIDFLDSLTVEERAKIYAYMEKLVELKSQALWRGDK